MSQHPSLRIDSAGQKHRNVLKRFERVKKLKDGAKWNDSESSIFGLPKVKSQKIQAKAGKEDKKEEAAAAGGAAPAGKAAPAAPAKAAAKPAAKAKK